MATLENLRETNESEKQKFETKITACVSQLNLDGTDDFVIPVLKNVIENYYAQMQHTSPAKTPKVDGDAIRIASWNLTDFSSKCVDAKKIDLVSATIVHHEFDVIALQEVGETKAEFKEGHFTVHAAIDILLKRLQETEESWRLLHTASSIGQIKEGMPVYGIFLYKSSIVRAVGQARAVPDQVFTRDPVVGIFQNKEWKFSLFNFHLTPRYTSERNDPNILQLERIYGRTKTEKDEILLGTFNHYVVAARLFSYSNLFGPTDYTNTTTVEANRERLDAILPHKTLEVYHSGHGVADIVLKGDLEESDVSTHKPIWADFKKV